MQFIEYLVHAKAGAGPKSNGVGAAGGVTGEATRTSYCRSSWASSCTTSSPATAASRLRDRLVPASTTSSRQIDIVGNGAPRLSRILTREQRRTGGFTLGNLGCFIAERRAQQGVLPLDQISSGDRRLDFLAGFGGRSTYAALPLRIGTRRGGAHASMDCEQWSSAVGS